MSSEVEQSDFCSRRSGRDIGEEDRAQRFVETNFSLHRKLREREPGEGLRDRAYLEDRVLVRSAVNENAPLAMIDYANPHAASGGFPKQAVLHHRRELVVRNLP